MPKKSVKRAVKKKVPPPVSGGAANGGEPSGRDYERMRAELKERAHFLHMQRLRAEDVLRRHEARLLERPEVTGLHVGLKMSKGNFVFPLSYAICVHVSNKLADDHEKLYFPLETEIEGIPVDVIEARYKKAMADPTTRFVDPIRGGIPIVRRNHSAGDYGTLGGVAFHNGNPVFITNRHVAIPSGADPADLEMVQPPNVTGVTNPMIGSVLDATAPNDDQLDAAIILAQDPRVIGKGLLDQNNKKLLTPLVPSFLSPADEHQTQCFKIGAVTGDPTKKGIVESVSATVVIDGVTMRNQIVVKGQGIMERGDSGSLVLVEGTINGSPVYYVVGLAHAVTDGDKSIVASHFKDVAQRFGISFS